MNRTFLLVTQEIDQLKDPLSDLLQDIDKQRIALMMELERTQFTNRQLIVHQFGHKSTMGDDTQRSLYMGVDTTNRRKHLQSRTLRPFSQSIDGSELKEQVRAGQTQSFKVSIKDKFNSMKEGGENQENQTIAASQPGSTSKVGSNHNVMELNDTGSEKSSVLIGRQSNLSASKNKRIAGNGGQGHTRQAASGSFFQRNSSAGISEIAIPEDHESTGAKQSTGSTFIKNVNV